MNVYLDWNATTPPHEDVIAAMADAAKTTWGNPSSVHMDGRLARSIVEDARTAIANLAACNPRDVIFTSGATEANNLAITSAMRARVGRLVTSALEHPSITRVAERYESENRVRWIRVLKEGKIDLEDLERALAEEKTAIVALQTVNHETGIIQPLREATILTKAAGAMLHVDAAQAWGKISMTASADSFSVAPHKFRGPKAIGALVLRQGVKVSPLLLGGSQEKGVRPGTLDPVLAAGFKIAATLALTSPSRYERVALLRDRLEARLVELGGRINGDRSNRALHVSNLAFEKWRGPELVAALDLEGVSCSSGSACSAGTAESSAALRAMLGEERANASVRLSLGETTSDADITRVIGVFETVLGR